ncbi:SAM-dependent methyltransferase [Malaciobacter mytili]|uniref:SAM-dependent methyltransferase n=1 Tax=Malaciobacter mytili LMG 24559 TaxID=1032238 RepID=A0AAX2AFW1_9BACT|nr:class I SAM-dependent methyltransferase [Malaciobacter mytili]AXH15334.1 SAM-dependent methyltransferase [Malaciobacter mytili LMG 24559]RXI43627.1 SAM-dependent methyltransferase [Malaciobacter mytili]RXK15728.1 SAM-dependent methyltransferase [Malaciobacter mytili LMG 24559]
MEKLKEIIEKNLENKTNEFKRVFHGRGNFYEKFNFLTVDSIDKILFIVFFEEIQKNLEEQLLILLDEIYEKYGFEVLILQRRYLNNGENEVLKGKLKQENYLVENGLKYSINFYNKNIGFFADMKNGREYILNNSKDKKVLNLFSYTCAFSVCAIKGGAKEVINVDMAKNALTIGRINHHLNDLDTKKVKFLPYNILKSWSRIKKYAPYDIIVIDPPSFQKGSFAASKDYEKIIKRLEELTTKDSIILSALNAPELDTNFIKNIFTEFAKEFEFIQRIPNLENYPSNNEEKSLKNMIFKRR